MVTRNFLNILAMTLQSGSQKGCLQVRDVDGNSRYLSGVFGFPYSPTQSFTLNAAAAGISIGTGTTPASEDDFQLEATITSGVNVVLTSTEYGAESPWYPYIKYDLTVTNTSANPLVVTEIGYKQNLSTSRYLGSTARENKAFLLDRCVLDTPVTIAPGDAGIVTYRLQTNPVPVPDPVAGIQMASFAFGTDAEIAAMLDAARAGTIDLQRDAGWRVGDQRLINVAAFTAGGNVAEPAQQIAIVITSFDEYMGCGNVLQFDMACCLTLNVRSNDTLSTTGGYGEMEIYKVTLPALAEALPDWLKSRLRTFSVLANAGGSDVSTLETVGNNKLALRSEMEVLGESSGGKAEEGAAIPFYAGSAYNRAKMLGLNNSVAAGWALRTAQSDISILCVTGSGGVFNRQPNDMNGLSAFGCI